MYYRYLSLIFEKEKKEKGKKEGKGGKKRRGGIR